MKRNSADGSKMGFVSACTSYIEMMRKWLLSEIPIHQNESPWWEKSLIKKIHWCDLSSLQAERKWGLKGLARKSRIICAFSSSSWFHALKMPELVAHDWIDGFRFRVHQVRGINLLVIPIHFLFFFRSLLTCIEPFLGFLSGRARVERTTVPHV